MGSVPLDPLRRRGSHFIYPAGRCPEIGTPLPPGWPGPICPRARGGTQMATCMYLGTAAVRPGPDGLRGLI